jgi:DedD protein
MSLLSFFRKNKQDLASTSGEFHSRAEEESEAVRGRGKRKASAADDVSDPLLPEKKRARRRLIGAIALVLAAVIGLPMIFDSEPKPLGDDIDVQIPSKDKLVQSSIHNVTPTPSASKVAASAALDQSEQIVEPASEAADKQAIAKAEDKPEAKAASASAQAKAAETKPAETKVAEAKAAEPKAAETKAAPKKEEVKLASKEAKPASKANDEERARAILEGREPAKDTAAAAANRAGKFAVQVAALRTQEKINELRGKLKGAGIETYTQKVTIEGGESTRIRVGPFATKEEADKMSAKLKKLGFNGTVIPPSS